MERGGPSPPRYDDVRRVRVLVVDDNAGFRESLLSLLDAGNLTVIGEAESGTRGPRLSSPSSQPDVVLMDVRMPEMDGIEACRAAQGAVPLGSASSRSRGTRTRTIVREMLVAGASGYVLKDSDGDDILHAVAEGRRGRRRAQPGGHARA